MVLGNTFHLHLDPGDELIARQGGLHRFMAWDAPIITDSGGFQVFSMGHGTVADEVKGRASHGSDRSGRIEAIEEDGVRFRSYLDGSERFMAPETSMQIQANLHSDIALVFDECTPFHVEREYTLRSTERTHRWLDRCLDWHGRHGPEDQLVYGIVQGGVYEDLRVESTQAIAARACDGIAIGGSLGAGKDQMYEVVGWATAALDAAWATSVPGTCSASARSTTSWRACCAGSTRSTARCRRGSGGTAWRSCRTPARAGAWTSPRRCTATPTSRSWRAVRARRARSGGRAATSATWRATAS